MKKIKIKHIEVTPTLGKLLSKAINEELNIGKEKREHCWTKSSSNGPCEAYLLN